jgi:hypothetical protein
MPEEAVAVASKVLEQIKVYDLPAPSGGSFPIDNNQAKLAAVG